MRKGFRGRGFLDQLHPLDLLELGHRLRGLRGHGAESIRKLLEGLDFLLLIFVGRALLLVAIFPLLEVIRIIACVTDELAIGDLMHLGDNFVHELAIVGNEQDRSGIMGQVLLQPEQ